MDSWIHEGLPPLSAHASVWLTDGSIRHVRREGVESRYFAAGTLVYTDCTHPLQNACCDPERVKAWRIEYPQDVPANYNAPHTASSIPWPWGHSSSEPQPPVF